MPKVKSKNNKENIYRFRLQFIQLFVIINTKTQNKKLERFLYSSSPKTKQQIHRDPSGYWLWKSENQGHC